MSRTAIRRCRIVVALVLALGGLAGAADAPPRRVPWTTSRVTGSPDAPLPYRLERAFPKLKFASPVDITTAPGSDRLFVAEQNGKILSLRQDGGVEKADLFIDVKKDVRGLDKVPTCKGVAAVYALTFHPEFEKNHYCYVCYVLDVPVPGPSAETGSRVSRFTVAIDEAGAPRADPDSEVVMVEWLAGGHNGCCLKFGPDGFLYISTGDAVSPSPPDALDTGQDLDDLLCCILRVDVNGAAGGKAYRIPPDNPFAGTPGARPEVWAYGLRNPWRMSFDRATGDLWIGDVGWELWEMVYRGAPGANYGWSITEGPQPVRSDLPRGPTPIVPPALALPHSESMSITGGFVYRGPVEQLQGLYVFADFISGNIWTVPISAVPPGSTVGTGVFTNRNAAFTPNAGTLTQVVGFGEDQTGNLFIVSLAGSVFMIQPAG